MAGRADTHRKSLGYLLWLFGFTGSHRFYYGRQISGTIWFLTLGLLGIGWLIDLFLIPGMGRILIEAIENDRIVGGMTASCTQRVKQFYETFVTGEVLATDAIVAEITKLTENAFRDVNIAFANERSLICDTLDIT